LVNGTKLSENIDRGYYFRISDIEVLDDGRAYLAGYDNDECECFTWIRAYDANGVTLKTNPFPGHAMARFEAISTARNVALTTTRSLSLADASFAVTWLNSIQDIPTAHVDSRDFFAGGARADILEPAGDHLLIGGEHDAGGGAAELLLGSAGESGGVDVDVLRPEANKTYDALGLAITGSYILMLGKQSNVGGSSPARVVVLFDGNRVFQDYDVEGNMTSPSSLVIGNDGGIYAVGGGPLSGVILTKLLIHVAAGIAPAELKAPAVGRLGMPVPNPSTSSVRLDYEVTGTAPTTMEIYDPAGRMVTRLVEGTPAAGRHVAQWDAHDVAKGVYFVRFKSGSSYATRKLVIE
jgi:Secretion system C-terminal sorting domain